MHYVVTHTNLEKFRLIISYTISPYVGIVDENLWYHLNLINWFHYTWKKYNFPCSDSARKPISLFIIHPWPHLSRIEIRLARLKSIKLLALFSNFQSSRWAALGLLRTWDQIILVEFSVFKRYACQLENTIMGYHIEYTNVFCLYPKESTVNAFY